MVDEGECSMVAHLVDMTANLFEVLICSLNGLDLPKIKYPLLHLSFSFLIDDVFSGLVGLFALLISHSRLLLLFLLFDMVEDTIFVSNQDVRAQQLLLSHIILTELMLDNRSLLNLIVVISLRIRNESKHHVSLSSLIFLYFLRTMVMKDQ